jgi:probable rRNA maturation factor
MTYSTSRLAENAVTIMVRNAQRKSRINRRKLEEFCMRALHTVRRLPRKPNDVLRLLRDVTVVLVSDRRMAALHEEFMNTPGATDVITFQDGDIFISVETAQRNARRFQTSLQDEIRLCIVHGLLHLQGFNDTTPAKSRAMNSMQRRILGELAVM